MPDDMDKKVDQIKNLLEDEKMLENIKNVITMFSGGNNSSSYSSTNDNSNEESDNSKASERSSGNRNSFNDPNPRSAISPINSNNPNMSGEDTLQTVFKIKKIYDKMVNTNDPGITLLNSLKPYLSNKRKSRLETAIKAMHLSKLSGIMHEIDE